MKAAIGASATVLCPFIGASGASQSPVRARQLTPGSKAKVFLAGVRKGAPEQAIKLAVRNAAEAANNALPEALKNRLGKMSNFA